MSRPRKLPVFCQQCEVRLIAVPVPAADRNERVCPKCGTIYSVPKPKRTK